MSGELRQRQSVTSSANLNAQKNKPTSEKKHSKSKFATVSEELQNATSSYTHRLWIRAVVVLAVGTVVYFYSINKNRNTNFALARENVPLRMQKFKCAPSYEAEMQSYPECVPKKCGRFVADKLIDIKEAEVLLDLARRIILKAGSSGGASILDIHTGALSFKEDFINVYNIDTLVELFEEHHLKMYNFVKGKIKLAIAENFGIPVKSLHLTYPTFFSRITNATAKTVHDEYWHEHVDKETYPSFHYTSLLYLTTSKKDFVGGRFIFVDGIDTNRTTSVIEPKMARVIAFTSGPENRHYVEQVTEGERYAITISFTCDQKLGIKDPQIKTRQYSTD